MFKDLKNFIKNLQAAKETTKRRWLFVLSAVAMILVIGSWTLYLNRTIVNLGETEKNSSPTKISQESSWQVFLTGLKMIASQIKEKFTAGRQIYIEPPQPLP